MESRWVSKSCLGPRGKARPRATEGIPSPDVQNPWAIGGRPLRQDFLPGGPHSLAGSIPGELLGLISTSSTWQVPGAAPAPELKHGRRSHRGNTTLRRTPAPALGCSAGGPGSPARAPGCCVSTAGHTQAAGRTEWTTESARGQTALSTSSRTHRWQSCEPNSLRFPLGKFSARSACTPGSQRNTLRVRNRLPPHLPLPWTPPSLVLRKAARDPNNRPGRGAGQEANGKAKLQCTPSAGLHPANPLAGWSRAGTFTFQRTPGACFSEHTEYRGLRGNAPGAALATMGRAAGRRRAADVCPPALALTYRPHCCSHHGNTESLSPPPSTL